MQKNKVVTEFIDLDGLVRNEYAGVLVDPQYALYVDPAWCLAVMERVRPASNNEYITTGGPHAVVFDLPVADVSFINRLSEMSAVDLLAQFIRREGSW